jgi:tellurite resistance protein
VTTKEAVPFSKSASGFLTDRTANTIAAAVTKQIAVVSIRDAITALSYACKLPACSGTSIGSERKRGMGSFVAMGNASAPGILASAYCSC